MFFRRKDRNNPDKNEQFFKWIKRGSSSVMCYIGTMWLMVLAVALFLENFNVYTKTGKTQLLADIVSDGACFIGDNGWGIVEENAEVAKNHLIEYNNESFGKSGIDVINLDYAYMEYDKNKELVKKDPVDNGDNPNNTVQATTELNTKRVTNDAMIKKKTAASTMITYSGGLKIVRTAWQYAYENDPAKQTPYVWGGGHGGEGFECLSRGADCSGFVSAIYRLCGYASIVGESCTGGLEQCGRTIADGVGYNVFDNARPGDIILYFGKGTGDGESTHTAIYAGRLNGVDYQIHSTGGGRHHSTLTYDNPGIGPLGGVHRSVVNYGSNRIKIQRIVNSNGEGEEVHNPTYPGLTQDQTTIINALKEYGYSDIEVAAMWGNWMLESGVGVDIREGLEFNKFETQNYKYRLEHGLITKDEFVSERRGELGHVGSEGYGLAQWTTVDWERPNNDRKALLWDHAEAMGTNVSDVWAQITFAVKEMNTGLYSWYDFSPGWADGMSIEEATMRFFDYYEAGGQHDVMGTGATRSGYAREFYEKYM